MKKNLIVLIVLSLLVAACAAPNQMADEQVLESATVEQSSSEAAQSVNEDATTDQSSQASAEASVQSGLYTVVDTNQNACYDDATSSSCPSEGQEFYGQDGQSGWATNQLAVLANGVKKSGPLR